MLWEEKPVEVLSVKLPRTLKNQLRDTCSRLGYSTTSECLRQLIGAFVAAVNALDNIDADLDSDSVKRVIIDMYRARFNDDKPLVADAMAIFDTILASMRMLKHRLSELNRALSLASTALSMSKEEVHRRLAGVYA